MLARWFSWALVAFAPSTLALTDPQTVYDALSAILLPSSELVLVSDNAYQRDFTPRYNLAEAPTYLVGVRPAVAEDVIKVVTYARGRNISLLTTGRGHGYTTSLGRVQGAINLDLGKFNSIQVDAEAKTMTIGGAVNGYQVVAALQEAGMEIPTPQCPCIGFAGASLGGGIGPYSGLYGPMSDSMLSVDMVTAGGRLLTVSETEFPDLFYGIKGSGFNFGVVVSLTFQVYPATNSGQAMNADITFLGSQNESVWKAVEELAASQPKELAFGLSVRYSPDPPSEGIMIAANFIYAGPQSEGEALMKPFLDLKPQNVNISTVAWKHIPLVANGGAIANYGCNPGVYYIPYSLNLYRVDVLNLVDVVNYMSQAIGADSALQGTSIVWQQYAQHGFQLRPDDSSAFPYRDAKAFVNPFTKNAFVKHPPYQKTDSTSITPSRRQIDSLASESSQAPALDNFGREIRDLLQGGSGKDQLDVYVHFAHGDEGPGSWYTKERLPKLLKLKEAYDPTGMFSWYNPIISAAP
ncbi:FAD-binding domain-containing protein [Apiospora aurea]|uniref:FAD-binding domain-containing protein n=1 Tax=Apiospora aurea TaxID=335848 RepID=A0ABR1QLA8_9PEZI